MKDLRIIYYPKGSKEMYVNVNDLKEMFEEQNIEEK